MVYLYLIPKWFVWIGISMEFLFALVTLIVALFAFKIYKLSAQRELKLFGISFLFIALAYVSLALFNLSILSQLRERINYVALEKIAYLGLLGVFSHMLFFIIGLVTLAYMTFKIKKLRIFILLLALSLAAVFLSGYKLMALYIVLSILLCFVVFYYLREYHNNQNTRTGLVSVAFIFLLLSILSLVFSGQGYVYYVVGHILELFSYLIILFNLIFVVKNEQKKK